MQNHEVCMGGDSSTLRMAYFDAQRRAKSEELNEALCSLTAELSAAEIIAGSRASPRGRIGSRKFALALEALVCNLLVVWLLDPGRVLAVPLANNTMFGGAAPKSEVYGQHFLDAVSALASGRGALAEFVTKGYKVSGGPSQLSTLRATPVLLSRFGPVLAQGLAAFRRSNPTEVLVLKSAKTAGGANKPLAFKETGRTLQLRREVQSLNEWLEAADAVVSIEDIRAINRRAEKFVDPSRRSVRRIFNNGKWTHGGRLYDAFWETMPRAYRFACLRIDGEAPANVDYSQLFPRLAYMRAGFPAPDGDLYAVLPGGGSRQGIKRLVNAMLFTEGGLKNWPEGSLGLFPKGTRLADVVATIEEFHGPIAKLFRSGIGHELAFVESNLLLMVLRELWAQGITALPLHDSVLVARRNAVHAQDVLRKKLEQLLPFGGDGVVHIDYGEE